MVDQCAGIFPARTLKDITNSHTFHCIMPVDQVNDGSNIALVNLVITSLVSHMSLRMQIVKGQARVCPAGMITS